MLGREPQMVFRFFCIMCLNLAGIPGKERLEELRFRHFFLPQPISYDSCFFLGGVSSNANVYDCQWRGMTKDVWGGGWVGGYSTFN